MTGHKIPFFFTICQQINYGHANFPPYNAHKAIIARLIISHHIIFSSTLHLSSCHRIITLNQTILNHIANKHALRVFAPATQGNSSNKIRRRTRPSTKPHPFTLPHNQTVHTQPISHQAPPLALAPQGKTSPPPELPLAPLKTFSHQTHLVRLPR